MQTNNIEKKSESDEIQTKQQEFNVKKEREMLETKYEHENSLIAEINLLRNPSCQILNIPHIKDHINLPKIPHILSPLIGDSRYRTIYGGGGYLPDNAFVIPGSFIIERPNFRIDISVDTAIFYNRAGPRKHLFFEPLEVNPVIVTCGGLCPGSNVVIREIYMMLVSNYKVTNVQGIKMGLKGFYTYDFEQLTYEKVKKIHNFGGTILGSSRGGFDLEKILDSIEKNKINQIYAIGGDGTHKAIKHIYEEICRRKLKISIIGIPKTIDNDIPVIDKSFGFETAVEETQRAIKAAYVESHCAEYGIGLVKVMGRNSGFIAMYASLASRDVNICLVPEFQFELYGPRGLLHYIYQRLKAKGNCVIVVAEGVPNAMIDAKLPSVGKDESGNTKFGDIGQFLKEEITKYCSNQGMNITLKLIDPTYTIRAIEANSYDKQYCSELAQNAVHAAMAGWTGCTIGRVNNKTCMIPLDEIIKTSSRITPKNRAWQSLLASTGQSSFLNADSEEMINQQNNDKYNKSNSQ